MLKSRTLFGLMLAVALVGGAYYLLISVPNHAKAGEPVLALANYFLTYTPIQRLNQTAYVVPDSLQVWDTPAEIRTRLATLKSGELVHVLGSFHYWTHVRMVNGQDGWVSEDGLMPSETHEAEERLLSTLSDLPVQATGQSADVDNIHVEPSRTAAVVAEVNPEQRLQIFGRRMVQRPSGFSNHPQAWYLVREGFHAGWILGRLVRLDIPQSISAYAQDTNIVAWLVLDTVDDNGHRVPQYVVADRAGRQACDFTHIRVLTWWKRKHTYATSYREGQMKGYFPILVASEGSVPHFRLRLEDDGVKYQKIYGLFDTITRVMGTADTWRSDAMPKRPAPWNPKQQRGSLTSMRR
jgi:hypothetical protein